MRVASVVVVLTLPFCLIQACIAQPTNAPEKLGVACVDDGDCQEPDPEHVDLRCMQDISEEPDGGMTLRCGLPCDTDDDCPYQTSVCHWTMSSVCQDGYEEAICKHAIVRCD